MHLASSNGFWNICEPILNENVFANIRTEQGHTPLHLASGNGHYVVVEKLIKSYAAQIEALDLVMLYSYVKPCSVFTLWQLTSFEISSVKFVLNALRTVAQPCILPLLTVT